MGAEIAGTAFLRPGSEGSPRLTPRAEAAVQHSHAFVAEVPQQPPETHRAALAGLVIRNDARLRVDAGPAGGGFEVGGLG